MLYANGHGCCRGGGCGSASPSAPSGDSGSDGPTPVSVLLPIKLGYKSYFIFGDIYGKLYDFTKSLLGRPLSRFLRRRAQPVAYKVSTHWFQALLLQLTGAIKPQNGGAGAQLEQTTLNRATLSELAEKFEVITTTAWKSSGPETRMPVCHVGDKSCRSRIEEVLYTAMTLFYSTVLSTQGSGALLRNFKRVLEMEECPFSAYSDPDFVNAADYDGASETSEVNLRLAELGKKKYSSEICHRFRASVLAEMKTAGVTLEEQVSKMKAEKHGHSSYTLQDAAKSAHAKLSGEPSFGQASLLAAVRGEASALGMEPSDCCKKGDAVAAAIMAAKQSLGPVLFDAFLLKTEEELRTSGELCSNMQEAIEAAKKKEAEKEAEKESGTEKKECCCEEKKKAGKQ